MIIHSNLSIALVIRSTLFILFFAFPQFLFSQNKLVSVDFQNEKIDNVLIQIAAENGYEISFNSSYFDGKKISIVENQQPIKSVLSKILEGTNIEISIQGDKIILRKYRKVFGQVIDQNSGETLINATVFNPKSGKGVLSNTSGYFSIQVPFENQDFIFSYVGYELLKENIPSNTSFPIQIKMKSNSRLGEIIVSKDEQTKAIEQELGKENLLSNEIKTLFATGGEPDVFQYLYSQPGITTGPDGLGGVHVRGGDVGQNLFLFDGVKVYTPFHSLGLFSVFDVNQLKYANFSKFGFHPKHGGRFRSYF